MNQYLKILKLDETASLEDIKASYRKLAKKLHPDITHDNGEKFKALVAAYEWCCYNFEKPAYKGVVIDPWKVRIKKERPKPNQGPVSRFTKYYRIIEGNGTTFTITLPERVLQKDTLVYYMFDDMEHNHLLIAGLQLPITMRLWNNLLGEYITLVFRYGEPIL